MKSFILYAFLFTATVEGIASGASDRCRDLFISSHGAIETRATGETTTSFIAYLENLLEQQEIQVGHLMRLRESITGESIENPILASEAESKSSKKIQFQAIQNFIDSNKIEISLLGDWLDRAIANIEIQQTHRVIIQNDTQIKYAPLDFIVVPPGIVEFESELGDGKLHKRKFELTEWIEVSVTPITQHQWFEIMGANPSKFVGFNDSIPFTVNGKQALLEPDYPVESLTWWSAVVFANELSRARGHELAYELKNFDFREQISIPSAPVVQWGPHTEIIMSAAASGRLEAQSNSNFTMVRKEGNEIYKSRGYRLPTVAEMYYLTKFYAAVPPKQSLDVIGNVRVWLQDSGFSYNGLQAKNPVYWTKTYKYGQPQKIWPFTFAKIFEDLTPPHIGYNNSSIVASYRSPDVGLILVRSIPPPDGGTSAR